MTQHQFRSPATPNLDAPRYAEIATFLRAPLATDLQNVDLGLIGIPYDGGLTNRSGARHGPREVRNQSSLTRKYHHVSRKNPFDLCRIADLGDVPMTRALSVEGAHNDISAFYDLVHAAKIIPISVGGDHSVTYPIFRSIARERKIGMVHIDAHMDLWDDFQGSKFSHGSPFRRAIEDGLLDPTRVVQIGIRGAQNNEAGWQYADDHGVTVIFIEEVNEVGIEKVLEKARAVVGDGETYLSFDIDSVDPVFAPGTGTPEIGGLTTIQAQALIRGLDGLDLVGADLVEISPPFDQTGGTSLVGASLLYEIACILSNCIANRAER
ncbi:agmatinase [Rhizobium leguminosarum]|uniref:Agmatinase n=1 Tax=Rhizobium leguminosarum TaxID=384 RepID=A0A6P0B3P4_RHILE|nr:agmatinase [Rhizobium leguminosarum]NEI32632.1 agmatinase [Rhizobium leguminosarum]NEI39391.1 agmatinase [Rhizobium leguminosarum]